jgi:hypothetical protein
MPSPATEDILFSKDDLIQKLRAIAASGWIENARDGNHGGVGNTLEDLLGIHENNLPIANAREWELKAQKKGSYLTLFHMEPSPTALKFVSNIFLKKYGWRHTEAGSKYPDNEMSFRQTIHGLKASDRGFKPVIDRANQKILISFDAQGVDIRHAEWLKSVEKRVGLNELNPQPYWAFEDLKHKAGTKLLNCFYVRAREKKEKAKKYFAYENITMHQGFNFEKFLKAFEDGLIFVDFDSRTHHNHGSKFRIKQDYLYTLYDKTTVIR